jgi:Alpha/beta hydrolase family
MHTVTSADGTTIAFDRLGAGPPVIVVGGASCDRARTRPFAQALAAGFTVLNLDRRGRGESGDTAPYAVAREVEDLEALVSEAGGGAALYGHSSGAALVLHAVAARLRVTAFVMHEPPYAPDGEAHDAQDYAERLGSLLADDRHGDAIALFMSITGMPAELIAGMRQDSSWAHLEALAPTLAYDSEVMGDRDGGTVPGELLRRVDGSAPALVLTGGASPGWMLDTNRHVADALPYGRHRILEGQEHVVAPELLAPVVGEFLAGSA